MSELTAGEVWKLSGELEAAAATLLGKTLFEFARLDMATGLCMVWVDAGQRLEALTKQATALTFHKKLDFLSQHIDNALPKGSKRHTGYAKWLARANDARLKRNQLVHGRWGVDPYRAQVINVVGLPTSPEQTEYRYTLAELQLVLDEMRKLQQELTNLRERWPL